MTENPKEGLEPLKNATPPTDKSPYDEETLKAVAQKASKHIPTQILSPKLQKAIAKLSETCAPLNTQFLSRFSDLQGLTIPKSPIDTTLFNHLDPVLGCTCAQKIALPTEILKAASQTANARPSVCFSEDLQKTFSCLNKTGTPTNTELCSIWNDLNSERASPLDTDFGELMQHDREIQAETNAQAIADVIREILEHQNKTADTRRNEDNRRLWRIALVTIIGSGITSAIGGWAVNYLLK